MDGNSDQVVALSARFAINRDDDDDSRNVSLAHLEDPG
jgi:hypothetical protein